MVRPTRTCYQLPMNALHPTTPPNPNLPRFRCRFARAVDIRIHIPEYQPSLYSAHVPKGGSGLGSP